MSNFGKNNAWFLAGILLLVGFLAACGGEDATATSAPVGQPGPTDTPEPEPPTPTAPEPPAAEEKAVFVGPFMVDCVGVGPQKCMQVKENPDDDYTLFYDRIEGFDYKEGYAYELLVKTEPVENPPADASSIKWTLIEEVSKTVSLEGRPWTLESYVTPDGETTSVLPGTEITAEFRDGQLGGNAGCNGYFGSYEVDGNNLTIGGIGMTEMYCAMPEGVMDQESAYLAALQTTATYQIEDDRLQIANADGETVLTYSMLEPTSLTGTQWQMIGYNNGKGGFASALAGTDITAVFSDDGRLAGSAGCNNYSTSYKVDGNNISIGPVAATMMMCSVPEGIMEQESAYLAALESAATYEIRGDQLEMRNAEGTRVVSYVAVPPASLEGTSWDVIAYNNGKEAVVSVIIDTEITASFGEDGTVTGSAGCNNYTASYEVDGENISIGPAATTRKMCSEPEGTMEQEAQYLAALESAATYQIQGDRMEMRTAEGALAVSFQEIVDSPDTSAPNITGTVWKWEQLTTPVDVTTVDEPDNYTIEFMPDGQVAIKADCNNGAGTYTIDGSEISIEIKALTMAMCPPGSLSDEFVKNLNAAAIYFMQDDNLFIDLKFDSGTMKFAQ